jgi:hypothetical protein
MGRPARHTYLPKRTGVVRVGFAIHGLIQTNYFRPLQTPKWIGPGGDALSSSRGVGWAARSLATDRRTTRTSPAYVLHRIFCSSYMPFAT